MSHSLLKPTRNTGFSLVTRWSLSTISQFHSDVVLSRKKSSNALFSSRDSKTRQTFNYLSALRHDFFGLKLYQKETKNNANFVDYKHRI